ncbi:hypothetical protein LTR05_003142 [Lithohypha guttulata]|uniref:Altered inheritance of mitochondria protein 11 n=1 Tax=Lithohypha guttulata TaxID=1690604 RepID=A0AAN7YJP5_9EURO|nr:hypothetical protein LTR05_003142 [Lithohypha guttulata]
MSWFSSFVSNFKFPPPADSLRPHPTQAQPHERRLLEEPSSFTKPIDSEAAAPTGDSLPADCAKIQEEGRRRNKLIIAAGLAFFGLSIITTRRSLSRRRIASQAVFFKDAPTNNAEQAKNVSGALEAVEALNIATINVLSVAMLATGGTLWYLDINSLADARKMIRGGLGVDGKGMTEDEANEEIEEAIASILARKDSKDTTRRT